MATQPPLQRLTANNHGPAVVVSSLVFMIVALATVVTRLLTRFRVTHRLVVDDWIVSTGMVLAIAQTTALIIACNHGLGRHKNTIDPMSFELYSKAIYAAEILLVATLAFTKASVACLIIGLHPPKKTIVASYATVAIVGVWALASILAIAFQCGLPSPWKTDSDCINLWALDIYNTSLNVLTDLFLILIPLLLMWHVQVAPKKRWLVIGFFASRSLAIAFAISAIITRRRAFQNGDDITWNLVETSIWTQAMQAVSIMTACLPSIRRFLGDLKTGITVVHISEPLERTLRSSTSASGGQYGSHTESALSSEEKGTSKPCRIRTTVTAIDDDLDRRTSPRSHLSPKRDSRRFTTHQRTESSNPLAENVILHTIDYEVKYQHSDNGRPADSVTASVNSFRVSSDDRITPKRWS